MGFAFDYPKDQSNVNGQGEFCAWGNYSAPIVGIQGYSATWAQGNGQVAWSMNNNGVWAAVITGNIPANTSVTLTVNAMSQPNPQQPPVLVQESITFTFQGPSPQTLMLAPLASGAGS